MKVPESWVEEHRKEIEVEADRIHKLRATACPQYDDSYDNWITACRYVHARHEALNGTKKDN